MVSGVVHAKIVSRIQDLSQGVYPGKASFSYDAVIEKWASTIIQCDKCIRVTHQQLRNLERNLGLEPNSMSNGAIIRRLDNIGDASPRSPYGEAGAPPVMSISGVPVCTCQMVHRK